MTELSRITRPASHEVALSVLVPNFNYGRYVAETIQSVLDQAGPDVEVVVTDNASTDNSVEVIRGIADARVRLSVNPCNVGFAANLERVAALARGRRMILLSSDDRIRPGALQAYHRLEAALGDDADRTVWGARATTIDAKGVQTGLIELDSKMWCDAREDVSLTRAVGFPVRRVASATLLKRSLELLRVPLSFMTTCYSHALHDMVGGYSGGRVINPDKWFLWKLMSLAETVLLIDHPLFDYRVHDAGQGPQELRSGALKHLTDQYVATFNLPEPVLEKAGLDRADMAAAFIEQDIALRGLRFLANGQRESARRGVHFGLAAYPKLVRSNPKIWALRALLALGPLGTTVAKTLRGPAERNWKASQRRPT